MALESVKYYYHTAILRNVYTIPKAIEILWIWYNGTCIDETCKNPFALLRQEPSQGGIKLPRAVVVEAQGGLLPLAGEAPIGGQARPCQSGPRHAIGIVADVAVRDFSPAGVRGKAGRAQMVAMEVGQHAALPHGHALAAQVVILGHRRSREAHVIQRHPAVGHIVEQVICIKVSTSITKLWP